MKTSATRILLSLFIIFIPFLVNGAEVSIDGSLSHSIEIKLPPGTNGMAPKLSLDYNSNSGNGIVGQGWSLSGLPSISRDTTNGIKYDSTDTFTGSAGRLVKQANGTYHYEYENFSKVEKYDSVSNRDYWIETRADGTKYYYGNYDGSSNAKSANVYKVDTILTPDQGYINVVRLNIIRIWAISKVEDIYGNFYTIEYEQEDGEYYPVRILYTQGNGISKFRVVDFIYEDRSDFYTEYTYSSAVTTKKRLQSINIQVDVPSLFGYTFPIFGTEVREYSLKYTSDGIMGRSILTEITELDPDDNMVSRSIFEWSKENDLGNSTTWIGHGYTDIYTWADMNGDGKTDYITSDKNMRHCVSLSTGNGIINTEWTGQAIASIYTWMDMNGDGLTDYITTGTNGKHLVSLSTGIGYVNQEWSGYAYKVTISEDVSIDGAITSTSVADRYAWVDMNGDGKTDYVTSDGSGHHSVSLSTGSGYDNQQWAGHGYHDRYAWVDLNGRLASTKKYSKYMPLPHLKKYSKIK